MGSSIPYLISDQDIDTLEDFLFEDDMVEDTLDYYGVHGLICSSVVGPIEKSDKELTNLIFIDHKGLSPEQWEAAEAIITKLRNNISSELSIGNTIDLPIYDTDEEHYEDALINWCGGFIEGFLEDESEWFARSQELVAELLLPIMSLSQLFDDEDFAELNDNQKIMDQFEEQLPELITDLFLLFHAENK